MGPNEVIIVAVVIIVLFGGKKLPELGRGLANGIREFKKALKGEEPEEPKEESKTENDI